jgi:hypothetical protein
VITVGLLVTSLRRVRLNINVIMRGNMNVENAGISYRKIETWLLFALLLFVFSVRANYFSVTMHQPLWWDEAEHMLKSRAIALGTPATGWYAARPPLLPWLAAAIYWAGLSEAVLRVLWVLLSTISLCIVYGIGPMLFNRRVGLYAVVLGSMFYVDLFHTMCRLVDVPQCSSSSLRPSSCCVLYI